MSFHYRVISLLIVRTDFLGLQAQAPQNVVGDMRVS